MLKPTTFALFITLTCATAASALELNGSVSYGADFIDGAPNAYEALGEKFYPDAKTAEPLAATAGVSFGRFGLAASYAHRYELFGEVGKVHDFALLGRLLILALGPCEVYAVPGVAVSRAPVPSAFLYGKTGPVYDWTAVVGADVDVRPFTWLDLRAGVSYRERPQIINFFEYAPCFGTVKSPALDVSARALYKPWPFLGVGPSFQQIFYGPYDYYLYGGTNQNEGWLTGKETYVMGTVAVVLPF